MAFYLGIDGGGSKTSCLIGNESSVLGHGVAGGSNVIRVGAHQARQSLSSCIQRACAEARVDPRQISRTVAGMAGMVTPELGDSVRTILAELVSGETVVVSDQRIALAAAFAEGPGVIVIAGTGSIAYGRDAQGKVARAGGWGFALGDEGSGYWIGRTALSAALRARDEGEASSLIESIAEAWKLPGHDALNEVVIRGNSLPAPDFAGLLPVVIAAEGSGDAIARRVLMDAGAELGRLARLIVCALFAQSERLPLAMSGGVFRHCSLVRETFCRALQKEYPRAELHPEVVEPVEGALRLARGDRL